MEMLSIRRVAYILVLYFFLACERFGPCASLNEEGRALLRFREGIEEDPCASLSNWGGGGEALSHCSWFGVECSDDGRVVALILKDLGLKGMLLPELGKLVHIRILDISNNSFYGFIPRELENLQKLEVLELRQNNLHGAIPSDLEKILSLKLQFYRETPPELEEINTVSQTLANEGVHSCRKCLTKTIRSATLRHLLQARELQGSASSNQTEREKQPLESSSNPTGQQRKRVPESSQPSQSSLQSPSDSGSSVPHWAIYALSIGGAVCLVVVATAMYLLFPHSKKDNTVTPMATGLSGQLRKAFLTGVPSLGRAELETACEGFSNVIGTSSDCKLYKGTLSSGVEIAVVSTLVESAKEWSDQSEEQFRKKISTLSKVNHKNFMNLIGCCTSDEPFIRMMVLEYAPCGSLFEHLHIKEVEPLDWPTRLRIIMGVTYCLEHMNQLDPPVAPRNLNSSSINLTEDYAAKISDTEFCKDEEDTNQESIVYKFGILLLEVVSGRLPFSEDHGLLVLWASCYLDGKRPLSAMLDPTLKSSVPDKDIAALCDVLTLCINPDPSKRPTMAEVAKLMKGITALPPDQATPRDNPLWWAELEIASMETG